ncbi:MAG: polysaccharide deacetylase family protein [Rikenellaceae bacterium]
MNIRPPKIIKKLYPSLIWNFHSEANKNKVFLTFDDGPTEEITYWILDTLDKYDAKATFFCLGKNVEQHLKQYHEIVKRGHIVANHSYSHIKGWGQSVGRYIEDADLANHLISSNLFRPPYARITMAQARRISERYNIIMWDVLSMDYSQMVTPKMCVNNVLQNVKGGSIVVFHDSLKSSRNMKYALPRVLDYLQQNGYTCSSIIL